MQITPHAEVVPDPERLPFIAAIRRQMHLFPAFRPDGPERNLRFAPFTRTPPHRTAWAAPEGGCPIPVLPFLCLLCKSFQRTTPPRAHGPLEGESGCKGSTKKADGQKNGDFFGPEGESFRKNRQNGGREGNGAPCHMGPTRDGGRSGTGAGAGRGGRIQRETLENAKKDYTAQGAMPGGEGEETGRHRKTGPPETQKGRTRKAGRAGWKTRKGTPEPPESPDGRGKGRKRKRGRRTRASPRTAKVRGKKAECKRGKKKQDKENGRERRAENPGRKHEQKAQGDGKGKACQIFRRDTWQAGKRKGKFFYSRITHKPHQYRIHLHRHHPYDKDYNLPAGRISRRGHTPMLDRHIPFSYI